MWKMTFPVDKSADLLKALPETLEVVDTHQLYGIWLKPGAGQEGGWLQTSGHVATWTHQKALDFVEGLGAQYEVRPVFLVTPKLS